MVAKSKLGKTKLGKRKNNRVSKVGTVVKNTKPKRKETKNFKTGLNSLQSRLNKVENEDSDQGEDMLDMIDEDDLEFIKNSIANRSYNILNKVGYKSGLEEPKSRKRKLKNDNEDNLEENYEMSIENVDFKKKIKGLLPIKTKDGIIPQTRIEDITEDVNEENEETLVHHETSDANNETSNTNDETFDNFDTSEPVSTAQLLAARNETLRQKKIHIGSLCASLLENPQEKVMNLKNLLTLMDEVTPEVYFTTKKIIIASMLEVFKDILPGYEIKDNIKTDGVKLKKETLKLKKYEETLLLYYKKYLQKLEKFAYAIVRKKGDTMKRSEEEIKLSVLSVQVMSSLLVTHPYFNYSQNVAQALVPFLNNYNGNVRDIVKNAVETVFKEDKRKEITLKILRVINNYLKNHTNVHIEMLQVLLVLNLKDVNLEKEKEQNVKQKKLKAHKSRILQLSKKERKRKKKLQEVEKELLETKAEENQQAKQKNLTEITKLVFNIYFRILKTSSNSRIIGVCLEGIAKFAHCINLEFYMDLVNILDLLLKGDTLNYKDNLHCIQTVFAILSGQGEDLNLDPTRFYNRLYKDLLTLNIASKNLEPQFLDLLKTLDKGLISRRKKITLKRLLGFTKRIATLSLQLAHDGSLGCLNLTKKLILLNKSVDILLDFDGSVGEGKFQAEIEDPEYSNAASTALYELILLSKHYHPTVQSLAKNVACKSSNVNFKQSPVELYEEFCMSNLVFNPPVPVPKVVQPKKSGNQSFVDVDFENECKNVLKKKSKEDFTFWIDL